MSTMIRLALAFACLPFATLAQGLNVPHLGAPGGLSAFELQPSMLPADRWDWGAHLYFGLAGIRAASVSPELEDALVSITCQHRRGAGQMNVHVSYWRAGTTNPGDLYVLDLFDSADSGRPAAYDLGGGWVSTADLSFPWEEAPPPAY
jgi:hypothetical protein